MRENNRILSRRSVLGSIGLLGVAGLTSGAGTSAVFTDTETESGSFQAGTWNVNRVVYTKSGDLKSLSASGSVKDHSPQSVDVIGSATTLLDGSYSIPFYGDSSKASSALQYVDDSGNITVLKTGSTTVKTQKAVVAATSWDGSPDSVFYPNANKDTIYRIAPDESGPTKVEKLGNGVNGVVGTADINGDGTNELAYIDSSAVIRYLAPGDSTEHKLGGVGSNDNFGAGEPASFSGSKAQVPIIDDGNNVALLGVDGKETLTSNSPAEKTRVTPIDFDEDSAFEIVFVHTDGYLAYVDDVSGTPSVKVVTDDTGSKITGVDSERGVQ